MPETLTIHLAHPITAARLADAPGTSAPVQAGVPPIRHPQSEIHNSDGGSRELTQLCALVRSVADKLSRLHEETIAGQSSEIARLAVEIAGKVLAPRIAKGDYDIQTVVEEALKRAPVRQNIVVRVNPEDLPACQKLQQDNTEGPFAGLEFAADWSIARADCLVETPKGIIKSFVEQHLERIEEALVRVE